MLELIYFLIFAVMAVLLLSSTLTILGNLLADVLVAMADPRVRQGVIER